MGVGASVVVRVPVAMDAENEAVTDAVNDVDEEEESDLVAAAVAETLPDAVGKRGVGEKVAVKAFVVVRVSVAAALAVAPLCEGEKVAAELGLERRLADGSSETDALPLVLRVAREADAVGDCERLTVRHADADELGDALDDCVADPHALWELEMVSDVVAESLGEKLGVCEGAGDVDALVETEGDEESEGDGSGDGDDENVS